MPPKGAKASSNTPLEKRLAASAGKEEMSHWNISELKQNLQEDSAVLEQTLREANKLLGESAGVPLVDIKGHVSKDAQIKRLRELLPAEAAEIQAAAEPGEKGSPREDGQLASAVVSGTFMTDLDVSTVSNTPTLVGTVQARMSEELALRMTVLEEAVGREAAQMLKLSIQSDLDQVCRMARKEEAAKAKKTSGSGKSAKGADLDEVEAQRLEEEALKVAAQEQVAVLKENLRLQSARMAEMQVKMSLLDTSSQEGGELVRKLEAEANSMREELLAAQHKTRVEEGERQKLNEKLRKKDMEVAKVKENMDKMTMQLQRLGEERDKMHAMLEDKRREHAEAKHRSDLFEAGEFESVTPDPCGWGIRGRE